MAVAEAVVLKDLLVQVVQVLVVMERLHAHHLLDRMQATLQFLQDQEAEGMVVMAEHLVRLAEEAMAVEA
jgi:predicted protein tyrosine phosphatase